MLIAHRIALYRHQLHVSPEKIESQRREDMAVAMRRISFPIARGLKVEEAFFVRKHADGTIGFEAMK